MNKALLGALFIVVAAMASCSKLEDVKTAEDTIRGTWSRVSGRYWVRNHTTGGFDTTVYYSLLPACIQDDALEFQESYKGLTHLGSNQCNAGDPEAVPFRWETTNAGTGIRIYDVAEYFPHVSGNVNASILNLTKATMTIRYTQETSTVVGTPPNSQIVRDTFTFTDIFRKQ
jgi:hypothetical protein